MKYTVSEYITFSFFKALVSLHILVRRKFKMTTRHTTLKSVMLLLEKWARSFKWWWSPLIWRCFLIHYTFNICLVYEVFRSLSYKVKCCYLQRNCHLVILVILFWSKQGTQITNGWKWFCVKIIFILITHTKHEK